MAMADDSGSVAARSSSATTTTTGEELDPHPSLTKSGGENSNDNDVDDADAANCIVVEEEDDGGSSRTSSEGSRVTDPARDAEASNTATEEEEVAGVDPDNANNASSNALVTDTDGGDDDGRGDDDDDDDSTESSTASSVASSRSASTLLSDQSDDSSSGSILSSVASEQDGSDDDIGDGGSDDDSDAWAEVDARLKRKFAERDKILKKIARENRSNKKYVEFLRTNEVDVRAETMRVLEERRRRTRQCRSRRESTDGAGNANGGSDTTVAGEDAADPSPTFGIPTILMLRRKPQKSLGLESDVNKSDMTSKPMPSTDKSLAKSIMRLLRFEFYHTIPCQIVMFLYCLAHTSIYELVSNIFLELTKNTGNDLPLHVLTLFASMLLPRLTGGVWTWANDDAYAAVKFDMHNRLRLRQLDARILRWFRRHRAIRSVVDIVSLYLQYMAVSFFLQYYVVPALLDVRDGVLSTLPSSKLSVHFCTTRIQEMLGSGISASCSNIDLSGFANENVCFDDSSQIVEDGPWCYDAEELAEAMTAEDEQYLLSKVSVSSYYSFIGDSRSVLTSPMGIITFSFAMTAFSVGALFRFGFRFWDIMQG